MKKAKCLKNGTKFIVWGNGEFQKPSIKDVSNDPEYIKGRLSIFRLLFYILFEKGFRWHLEETIKYAMMHHENYQGENASDVILFYSTKGAHKIFRTKRK